MLTLVPTRSLVPAFFIVDGPTDTADEAAGAACIDLNHQLCEDAAPNRPRVRLLLCEASPTSEITVTAPDDEDPHTLEGYSCDARAPNRQLVERLAATLENVMVHLGPQMTPADRDSRARLLIEAGVWLEGGPQMELPPGTDPDRPSNTVAALIDAQLAIDSDQHPETEAGMAKAIGRVRAAYALIKDIALTEACGNSEPDVMARHLDSIVGRCQGFLREEQQPKEGATAAPDTAITLTFELNDRFCADVMCTALEGGIGYWSEASAIVKTECVPGGMAGIADYESCILTDAEGDEDWEHRLDYAVIRKGVAAILTGQVGVRSDLAGYLRTAVAENDTGNVDAEVADVIVQAGIFGELVYG